MQSAKRPDEAAFEAGFNKVAHGIPYERELAAMSYAQLAVLLGSCPKGSPKYLVVEREMAKRAHAEDGDAAAVPKRWFERPLGLIALGTLASLLASVVWYLFWRD